MAPQDPVEEIKNRLDIKEVISDYIRIEKSGINYRALCPFHQEKTPSFFISPTRQIWRCFGCGLGGDMFTFIQQIEGSEFPEALQLLAKKAGVEVRRQNPRVFSAKNKSLEICELAAKYFRYALQESKNGQKVAEYLKSRGINEKSSEQFKLGYAPSNSKKLLQFIKEKGYSMQDIADAGVAFRLDGGDFVSRYRGRIIFPIFNTNGNVTAFGARKLPLELAKEMGKEFVEDSAKYINSPQTNIYDKSRILYGLDKAKIAIRQNDACIIVEGYTDVIMAHQAGFNNVVASSGTALTENQLDLIKRFTNNLVTSFDMDAAGDSATRRGIDLAQLMGFNVKVIIAEGGKDPADVIAQDPKEWEKALKNTKSITQFYFDSALGKFDAKTPEGKREIAKELAPVLKNIPSKIEQAHWAQELAVKLKVPEEVVWQDIKNAKDASQDRFPKKSNTANIKEDYNKKRGLERQIVLHALKEPKLAKLATEELPDTESEEHDLYILHIIKNIPDKEDFKNKLSKTNKEMMEELFFEDETFPQEYSEQNFYMLIAGYKKIILEQELKNLEKEIFEIENRGDGMRVKELVELFQQKATERAKLN